MDRPTYSLTRAIWATPWQKVSSVDAIVCVATIAHSQWKSLVTWTDLSNNGHKDEHVSESATSMCYTRAHAATVQTGHDVLERDFKAMKDNYDKVCSENQQLKCIVYQAERQGKEKSKR